jgi:hypothetical protein
MDEARCKNEETKNVLKSLFGKLKVRNNFAD